MIKKTQLNELIKTYDLPDLESHLVHSYITNQKIDFSKSPILTAYFKDFHFIAKLAFEVASLNIITIKELENYLELLIPIGDKKYNGAFFTPSYIIDFIINEIKPGIDDVTLDPSCGCGAFLIGLTDYYQKKFGKSVQKTIQENIYGSDILEYNILRTKLILTIYALQHNEILNNADFNLFHQDSLKTKWKVLFDNIVGNPPYVKFQDLSLENREFLAQRWTTVERGTFNLYFAFFELGYQLLKPTGKLGYITPNNYFTSLAGEAIRKYFQQKKCVSRIIDFSHKKVFDARTYTAITFLNKKENESIMYDRIKDGYSPESFLHVANGSSNLIKNLNYKKWRLLKTDEQKNIQLIENIGTPIGKLYDICVGIATLKDEIFFINGEIEKNGFYSKKTEHGIFEIEKEITKPVYKISDFKTQAEIEKNTRRIICPYNICKGVATPFKEREFKERFPKCYIYFLSEKENLLARDKGKVQFEPFFVWGRTQGLTRTGKKLLNPTFSQQPRFLLIEQADGFFTNGYGIYFKDSEKDGSLFTNVENPLKRIENMDVVQKILNSYIMQYYISKTSVSIEGGYPCYQKNFIEKFTIPELSIFDINTLRKLNDSNEIDDFLIDKYQLTVHTPNLVL